MYLTTIAILRLLFLGKMACLDRLTMGIYQNNRTWACSAQSFEAKSGEIENLVLGSPNLWVT